MNFIKRLSPEWKIFLIYFFVLLLITKPYSMSDNEVSRFNAIKAMVENHRLEIGTSGFNTVDKVYIGGNGTLTNLPCFFWSFNIFSSVSHA